MKGGAVDWLCICVIIAQICFVHPEMNKKYLPTVIWHGMGDTCCSPFGIGRLMHNIKKTLPGIHVVSLRIGNNIIDDMENAYFMHPDKQVQLACKLAKADPLLANGFNMIGLSQGSLFSRALVQRCPEAKVKNLISIGGPQQGVYGIPNCAMLPSKTCDLIRETLNRAAYEGWVQKKLTPATFWHDPLNEELYRKRSSFLADINNENEINQTYNERLSNLDNFVMVKFLNDNVVQPIESEWFGFYEPGQASKVQDLRSSDIYKNDRLGLRKMDQQHKLTFIAKEGKHMKFSISWFIKTIVLPYLS